ncbi:hypothetical protein O181_078756 [Austropuccinia psidii MF-1]|uniref:Uncharacterized protein n=1 Tax=Austropuccinia psidii MF-1 TaxID=1389203 RepID=A0A9Q3FEW8_9BASI|nr:hypothetical protein [Austropuccinia psidii MF-1]
MYNMIRCKKPNLPEVKVAASSCITNIVINQKEAKIHFYSGAFFTCFGKDYLEIIYTNWQESLIPIEGINLRSSSEDMHPLDILEAEMQFPHPAGSIRLKVEFVVINKGASQHFILGSYYLNIYGININNDRDRYLTIGENNTQKFSFHLEKREITAITQLNNLNKETCVSCQLIEVQIIPELKLEMEEELAIFFQYREGFASDNEPL